MKSSDYTNAISNQRHDLFNDTLYLIKCLFDKIRKYLVVAYEEIRLLLLLIFVNYVILNNEVSLIISGNLGQCHTLRLHSDTFLSL